MIALAASEPCQECSAEWHRITGDASSSTWAPLPARRIPARPCGRPRAAVKLSDLSLEEPTGTRPSASRASACSTAACSVVPRSPESLWTNFGLAPLLGSVPLAAISAVSASRLYRRKPLKAVTRTPLPKTLPVTRLPADPSIGCRLRPAGDPNPTDQSQVACRPAHEGESSDESAALKRAETRSKS
jgi:hypothetical protein